MISPNMQFPTRRAEEAEAWHAAVAARARAGRISRTMDLVAGALHDGRSPERELELLDLLVRLDDAHNTADAEASAQGE